MKLQGRPTQLIKIFTWNQFFQLSPCIWKLLLEKKCSTEKDLKICSFWIKGQYTIACGLELWLSLSLLTFSLEISVDVSVCSHKKDTLYELWGFLCPFDMYRIKRNDLLRIILWDIQKYSSNPAQVINCLLEVHKEILRNSWKNYTQHLAKRWGTALAHGTIAYKSTLPI